MAPAKISITLCTYNGEKYLSEQMDSLLKQDWPNFEIVAVDDGSSDGTRAMLQRYAENDNRIRLFFNEKNLGYLKNFEYAISLAEGEFIAPCDQDDYWYPEKLSTLYSAIGNQDMVYCDSALMNENSVLMGKKVSDKRGMYQGNDPAAFVFSNCISGHAMLFRRTMLKHILPFPAIRYHDWWIAFVAASNGGIGYVPKVLINYRQHMGALTNLSKQQRKEKKNKQSEESYDRRETWFRTMASFASPHQAYFSALLEGYMQRRQRWFAFQFAWLLWQHRDSAFYIKRLSAAKRFTEVLKRVFGAKWKVSA